MLSPCATSLDSLVMHMVPVHLEPNQAERLLHPKYSQPGLCFSLQFLFCISNAAKALTPGLSSSLFELI